MSELLKPKRISVALATYNGARFLRQQLDSIYAQTRNDFEVFARDDGSSDSTVAILEEYRERYGLHYCVNAKNLGFLRNFEQILADCRGEFVVLADQDDIWMPDKLERLVSGIGDADLIYSDAALIDEKGSRLADSLMQVSGVQPIAGFSFIHLVCNTSITGCTIMFRRSLLDVALPIPECEQYHDWWLAIVAACHGGITYLPMALVHYRQHTDNDTGASVKKSLISRVLAHLSGATEAQKRHYYLLLRNRSRLFIGTLQERLALTPEHIRFLRAVGMYADSLLKGRKSLQPFLVAVRYHKILYPTAGLAERVVFVCSKLIIPFLPRKATP